MMRKLILELRPQTCRGVGPDISIILDNILIDRLMINRNMSWHSYIKLEPGDHDLKIMMQNEDNTRFFDYGEDPNGEIRALHLDKMRFANDGINVVDFDLRFDVLADGSYLFIPDESAGILPNNWGFSMYKNASAHIILPVR
jgi:hypothetical protein